MTPVSGLDGRDVVNIVTDTTIPGSALIPDSVKGAVVGGVVDRLPQPVAALGDGVLSAAGGVADGLNAAGTFLAALGERGTWVRVIQVVGGGGLIFTGLVLLGRDTAMSAASGLADVVPAGRAVKVGGAALKGVSGAAGKRAAAAASSSS